MLFHQNFQLNLKKFNSISFIPNSRIFIEVGLTTHLSSPKIPPFPTISIQNKQLQVVTRPNKRPSAPQTLSPTPVSPRKPPKAPLPPSVVGHYGTTDDAIGTSTGKLLGVLRNLAGTAVDRARARGRRSQSLLGLLWQSQRAVCARLVQDVRASVQTSPPKTTVCQWLDKWMIGKKMRFWLWRIIVCGGLILDLECTISHDNVQNAHKGPSVFEAGI